MTKIDRKFIPSILKNRNNGATYQELAVAMKCSISGIRKVIKQNDFTLIEEILIASFTPEQRISVAYHASLVHDDLIKQYLSSYFEYANQVGELQKTTIAVLNKTLDSLGIVMEREFSRKTTNSDKQLRTIGRATKRAVSKDTSFIMESLTKDDDSSYNDNIDVIDVTEFEKQHSSCMMDWLLCLITAIPCKKLTM